MAVRVDFSQQAKRDLREIRAFIARNNPARARSFGQELLLRARSLGEHPHMGRVVAGQHDAAVREIVHGAYRIIYEIFTGPERISILRFWHGARGAPRIVED